MIAIDLDEPTLDQLHDVYATCVKRWTDTHIEHLFSSLSNHFQRGTDLGWWSSDKDIGERFSISRQMAGRIRNSDFAAVGKTTVQRLAYTIAQIDTRPDEASKRTFILQGVVPVLARSEKIDGLGVSYEVEAVAELVGKLDHLPCHVVADQNRFKNWLRHQHLHFHEYSSEAVRLAAIWLAVRPKFVGYPDLLKKRATDNGFFTSKQRIDFVNAVEFIGRLRRATQTAYKKLRATNRLLDDTDISFATHLLLAEVSEELDDVSAIDREGVVGLLNRHSLDLNQCLTLTHGELLERSTELSPQIARLNASQEEGTQE